MKKSNGLLSSLRLAYPVFTILMLFAWVSAAHAARTEKTIHFFWSPVGYTPNGLLLSSSGTLYGVTTYGGAYNMGLVYELTESRGVWKETVLYSFTGGADGGYPNGPLVMDEAGNLYGAAGQGGVQFGSGVVFELSPSGGTWTETVLYNFTGLSDGGLPSGGLVFDAAGNLYGTAGLGGVTHCQEILGVCGVVFQLSPSGKGWTEHVLHSFTGLDDGSGPQYGVILDSSGNVYGTTFDGGGGGAGVVFELTLSNGVWQESVLHAFSLAGDGIYPAGSLVFDRSGNLYGATEEGGTGGYGTVFELTSGSDGWTETILHNFPGGADGAYPVSVVLGTTAIYGVTLQGGTGSCPNGASKVTCGTVFELTSTNGWTKKKIYNFHGTSDDGGFPSAGLIMDSAGHLFGTLHYGGGNLSMAGGVFEVNP